MAKYLDKPIEHVDVSRDTDLRGLLGSFTRASFQARNLSRCADIYREMLQDDQAVIFLGLAGALVPGGMRRIIADLIRYHLIDVMVSTGANLYHDFFEAMGYHHYVGDPAADDAKLRQAGVDRIYDVFASDTEFGKAIIQFTEAWAELLESAIDREEPLSKDLVERTRWMADKSDRPGGWLTGFMQGVAEVLLSKCWEHGAEIREFLFD